MNSETHVTISVCSDPVYVDWVAAHELVRDGIGSDQNPQMAPAATFLDRPEITFLRADLNGEPAGGFLLIDGGKPEVHTMLLTRGADAVRVGRAGVDWVRHNKPWPKLYSRCFCSRPDVVWFALRCGFHRAEVVDLGATVHGIPVLTQLLELSF